MDDLRYLAKYSPECFEKACKNVIYNRPETAPVMAPNTPSVQSLWTATAQPCSPAQSSLELTAILPAESTEQESISQILSNLTLLELDQFPICDVNAKEVKNLLGNLYMELLFPHNDSDMFFEMYYDPTPRFDRKA